MREGTTHVNVEHGCDGRAMLCFGQQPLPCKGLYTYEEYAGVVRTKVMKSRN